MQAQTKRPDPDPQPGSQKFLSVVRRESALLLSLPKAQILASLLILQDIAGRVIPLKKGGYGIERSPGYYAELPALTARKLVPYLIRDALGGRPITIAQAGSQGFPVRSLADGAKGYGQHYHLPAQSMELAAALIYALTAAGYSAPLPELQWSLGDPLPDLIMVEAKGTRNFILCPEHDDHTPSAIVNKDGSCWCFACSRMVGVLSMTCEYAGIYRPIVGTAQAQPYEGPDRKPATADTGVDLLIPLSASIGPYSIAHIERTGEPGRSPDQPALGPTGIAVEDLNEAGETSSYVVPPQPIGLKNGTKSADKPLTRYGKSGMATSYAPHIDLLDALQSSWRRWKNIAYDGVKTLDRAAQAEVDRSNLPQSNDNHRHVLPDRYISFHWYKHQDHRSVPLKNTTHDRAWLLKPEKFYVVGGQWVLVDLDNFTDAPLEDQPLAQAGEQIRLLLEEHPCFSGRVGVIRTSHMGVQVVAQLAQARWNLQEFYADLHVRRMLSALSIEIMDKVREVGFICGKIDPTSHAPGRNMRRPGPRIDKAGRYYISRLVYSTL